jgi:hypothetical protein
VTVCSEAAKVTPRDPAFDKASGLSDWRIQSRAESSGSPIETDPVPQDPFAAILPEIGETLNPHDSNF